MFVSVRDRKGQGNSALYVRVRDTTGRYWDFSGLGWLFNETVSSRTFLGEVPDSDPLESRYLGTIALPSGDVVVEYVRIADGSVLAEDGAGYTTDLVNAGSTIIRRIAALNGANRVVDQEILDSASRVTAARIRIYDTAANAQAATTAGLLGTYTVTASYALTGETTMTITEVLPS